MLYLVNISLSDNKDQLGVLLHHGAVLQDTLHLHRNLLAPDRYQGVRGPRLHQLLPQESVLCVRKEKKIMQEEAGLICYLLVNTCYKIHQKNRQA